MFKFPISGTIKPNLLRLRSRVVNDVNIQRVDGTYLKLHSLMLRYFKLVIVLISYGKQFGSSTSFTFNGFRLISRYSKLTRSAMAGGNDLKLLPAKISLRNVVSIQFNFKLKII